ncbi:olfactory receptor 142-like [Pangasianodon hypophthalmus]|uniref:olfactory receptor 142-like n=1 Tax=Pangasianodon hypophthalmus TaxID=310915 RepID=UPI002307F5CC|nr:olfactory receptor 142-like [Pangasianodon hypophthalmus]XP_053096382.1 olfactory receptor 142-like [Pangasianodon hypophthalmus]
MENRSSVTTFILDGYFVMDQQKLLFFFIFLLLYIAIFTLNSLLIAIIYFERTLHNPMYIFVCNLSCNGIFGSTSLIPHLLFNLTTEVHKISLTNCLIQIFCLHTYNIIELTILAFMSYDRYVAICYPLHYHDMMSTKKLQVFIFVAWAYPFASFLIYESFTIRLTFCREIIDKTHCVNFELIKQSCTDITVHSIIGLGLMAVYMIPQVLMILFSYAQILYVCIYSSKECQTKAIQTCTPHLLAVLNYFVGIFFEIIQSRLNSRYLPYEFRTFMSLYFMIVPPLFNPVIYGMSGQVINKHLQKLFCVKSMALKN